jgi:hypothetical protein
MGQIESALGHHFDQIPEAELVAQIPAYAQDHLTIEVPPSNKSCALKGLLPKRTAVRSSTYLNNLICRACSVSAISPASPSTI